MTAPGALLELLDGAVVGIFGILLSAAFCPIRWTDKKRWALADRTAGLPGHGLGVRSICAISERYGGLTSFAAKDGQFTLRVML